MPALTHRVVLRSRFEILEEDLGTGRFTLHQQRNMIVNDGLRAWAYNMINGDGDVLGRLLLGTGNTAVTAADTALDTQVFEGIDLEIGRGAGLLVGYYLLDTDQGNGNTFNEAAIAFNEGSGVATTDGKLFNRVVLNNAIVKTSQKRIYFTYSLTPTLVEGNDADNRSWDLYEWSRRWFLSRLIDLSEYGVLNRIAFGSGVIILDDETETLGTEDYKEDPSWTRDGSLVECDGTVTSGEHSSSISEGGPKVGTGSGQILSRFAFPSWNPASGDLTYHAEVRLQRVGDSPVGGTSPEPTHQWVFGCSGNISAGSTEWLGRANHRSSQMYRRYATRSVQLRDLRVYCNSAPGASETVTLTVYKNGVATSLVATVSDTDNDGSDTSNTVSLNAGDYVEIQVVASASANNTRVRATVEID